VNTSVALCKSIKADRAPCNTPADPKSDPSWPLCSKHLTAKRDVDRRWGPKESRR
jgi:hypothetical protein